MTRPRLYRGFGLTIASPLSLPLPELPERGGEPDVEIVTGRVPSSLPDALRRGVRYQVAPGKVWLQVDGVARYLARGGEEIVVDRAAGADDDGVRLFLLGPVLAATLHLRGGLPLSASAVATERGAAVFMGLSGAGKSTLAAGLHGRGHRVLTDDLCAISFQEGTPMVWPGCPELILWPNTLQRLGIDPDPLRRVRSDLEKRALPLGPSFASEPLTPLCIYHLKGPGRSASVEMTPVEGPGRVATLGIHTYGAQFVEGLGREASCLENLAVLACDRSLKTVTWPQGSFALKELVHRIEEDLAA